MGGAHHTFCMEAHMFCMESGSKSGKLWLAPLIAPRPNVQLIGPPQQNSEKGRRGPSDLRCKHSKKDSDLLLQDFIGTKRKNGSISRSDPSKNTARKAKSTKKPNSSFPTPNCNTLTLTLQANSNSNPYSSTVTLHPATNSNTNLST